MGSCLCKEKEAEVHGPDCCVLETMPNNLPPKRQKKMDPDRVDQLIREVLNYVGSYQSGFFFTLGIDKVADGPLVRKRSPSCLTSAFCDSGGRADAFPQPLSITPLKYASYSGDDVPPQLLQLNNIADSEDGWIGVVQALVRTVPMDSPLGASTISIVFDDCPLPAKETVLEFARHLHLNRDRADAACNTADTICEERNVLVIIACIAEKFGGPQCARLLNEDVLGYITTFLMKQEEPTLVIHALIALEKFAYHKENKVIIENFFEKQTFHPILPLDLHYMSSNYLWRQVGFFARWALDNTFESHGRPYSYETEDMSNINCILNTNDTSEYLKISADGLEARCDSHFFESVRATFKIDRGCWYYEVEIVSPGVMQIGWASKQSTFQNHEGFGVGDDTFSLSYDGCRRLIWHRAIARPEEVVKKWEAGDFLGCLIDISRQEAVFSLNGRCLPVCTDIFAQTRTTVDPESGSCSEGFYPAASFMAHQQCRFNFGAKPFKYPPSDREFQIINEHGSLTDEDKKVVPRRVMLERIRLEERSDGPTCSVCYNAEGNFGIYPCEHDGFCRSCASKLDACPMCRKPVGDIYVMLL